MSYDKIWCVFLIRVNIIWAASWQIQQNGMCTQRRLDQRGHPPSQIRVFAVRMKKAWVLSYQLSAQWSLWLDWADAQADPSLRWAHISFCWFCHKVAQIVFKGSRAGGFLLDAQADLSLRWAHMQLCWFCHEAAHFTVPSASFWVHYVQNTSFLIRNRCKPNKLQHDKTNKLTCAPCEDSDQPGHPPSLIRVFAVRIKKAWVLSYQLSAQWSLWLDWADTQADPSLRWAHISFCWFCHKVAQIVFKGSRAGGFLLVWT